MAIVTVRSLVLNLSLFCYCRCEANFNDFNSTQNAEDSIEIDNLSEIQNWENAEISIDDFAFNGSKNFFARKDSSEIKRILIEDERELSNETLTLVQENEEYNCSILEITSSCIQYTFAIWDNEGKLIHNSDFHGTKYKECFHPSQCYFMEFVLTDYESCKYEVILNDEVVLSRKLQYYEESGVLTGDISYIGSCPKNCPSNENELILITYLTYLYWEDMNYELYTDESVFKGSILEGNAKRICLKLERCNVIEKITGFAFFYLLSSDRKEQLKSGIMDNHIFGSCTKQCNNENSLIIRAESDVNYTLYKDDNLLQAQHLKPFSYSNEMCISVESCFKIEIEGSATYFFFRNDEITGIANTSDLETFGQCICSKRPILSETKRGKDILTKLATVSGMEKLADFNSDHYKAACWLIYEDLRNINETDSRLIQRYVLVLFFFTTNGNYWFNSKGFLTGKDECEWSGIIKCDEDLFVSYIDLENNNLTGTMSIEFFSLLSLESIYLRSNSLDGSVPEGISRLAKLNTLDLYNNKLTGTLPLDFMSLPSLVYLDLSSNYFSGTFPVFSTITSQLQIFDCENNYFSGTLPDWLYKSYSVETIRLYSNFLTGTLSSQITDLKNLSVVELDDNSLSGIIPEFILYDSSLSYLDLHYNALSGTIPNKMNNKNITALSLHNNYLTGTIPSTLTGLKAMEELYLNNNYFTGTFPKLDDLRNLSILQIENNNIIGSIIFSDCSGFHLLSADCSIPRKVTCDCCTTCNGLLNNDEGMIPCISQLELFFDSQNKDFIHFQLENSAGHIILEDAMWATESATHYKTCYSPTDCYTFTSFSDSEFFIYLNNELILADKKPQLPIEFGYSKNKTLQMDTCDDLIICGKVIAKTSMKRQLVNLLASFLSYDQVFSNSYEQQFALCWWLEDLDRYEDIELQNEGLVQRYFLASLYFATSGSEWYDSMNWLTEAHECDWFGVSCTVYPDLVSELMLVENNLRGELPKEIGELRGARHLDFSSNNLRSTIPKEIAQLSQLETLILKNNNMQGEITSWIKLLSNLKKLDISSNELTGTLPSELGLLENLFYLNFTNNAISGEIPETFANLKNINSLSFSKNLLKGNLMFMENLSNIENVEASFNYFSGSLPIFGINQKRLMRIVLDNNQFSGSIPSNIDELSSLRELLISSNQVTGALPSQIGRLCCLSSLSVSYNLLKGSISSDLSNIQSFSLLHLHNNNLEGNADHFNYSIASFITDCGNTKLDLSRISCETCTQCCNNNGDCITTSKTWPRRQSLTEMGTLIILIILTIAMGIGLFCLSLLLHYFGSKRLSRLPFQMRARFNEGSVFRFYLSDKAIAWVFPSLAFLSELWIVYMFLKAGDIREVGNMWAYSESCPKDNLACQDQSLITLNGWISFGGIISVFLLPDILNSVLLFYECSLDLDYKGIFASIMLLVITVMTIFASAMFILAKSISNIEIIQDAVIVLFLNSIDEQIYIIVNCIAPAWLEEIESQINEFISDDDNETKFTQNGDSSSILKNGEEKEGVVSQSFDESKLNSTELYLLSRIKDLEKRVSHKDQLCRDQSIMDEPVGYRSPCA